MIIIFHYHDIKRETMKRSPQTQTPRPQDGKRQRLDAANATLKKPFRSPMINRQASAGNTPPSSAAQSPRTTNYRETPAKTPSARPSTLPPITPLRPSTAAGASPLTSRTATNTAATNTASRPLHRSLVFSTPRPQKRQEETESDDFLARIQRSHREMQDQLKEMQKQLDLIRQAKRIKEASERKRPGEEIDIELKELVGKWKNASKQAAEEVFELIKGRVDNMGGGEAWRDSRRRGRRGYDDGDAFGDGKKKRQRDEDEDDEGDAERYGDGEEGDKSEEEEEDEAEGFTMLMMLKSLNIEPEVLGYDPEEDKWVD
ncbi:hypothetical protein QBC35DRAFT_481171 [Podospora australis]|uniref:Swi5-dependent recombination DNA repair protein 1 n=1 Tax=Podospora australis TaxID=1536484 RepID=A0AAN6X8K7_9PEZI|nr:hypothetical protein QBC35DRAFT_481171 [Podospora australis]